MGDEYEYKRIAEELYPDFTKLVADSIGETPTNREIAALFDTDIFGARDIGFIAYHKPTGHPAAFYGVFPCEVEYQGVRHIAAQSGSTMTHSAHRKRGLFIETAKRTYELAASVGIEFLFGFPNKKSHRGLQKLGWATRGNFSGYHILVPTLPIGMLFSRVRGLKKIHDWWFSVVASRWRTADGDLPHSAAGADSITVTRDARSRTFKPCTDHRLIAIAGGVRVLLNHHDGSVGVGDCDAAGQADFRKMMRSLKWLCFLTGSIHLRTHASPGCPLDLLFKDAGYRARPGAPICDLNLTSKLPLEHLAHVYADFDTF
jgi:hypothetical protein